jgi:hypothetical protein
VLFEKFHMAAYGPPGDTELVGRAGEAPMPGCGLEGPKRIQRWKFHASLLGLGFLILQNDDFSLN